MITAEDIATIRKVVIEAMEAAMTGAGSGPIGTAEACRYLGVSRGTLYAWMRAKTIPTRHATEGGRLYFFRNELDEALKRNGREAVQK